MTSKLPRASGPAQPPARPSPARTWGALALLLAAAACQRDPAAPVGARIVEATVLEVPAPLARELEIVLDRPAAVEAVWWAEGEAALRVASGAPAERHTLTVARLTADRAYTVEVRALEAAGGASDSRRAGFRTAPLPADLATVTLRAEGTPTHPLTLLEVARGDAFRGFVVVDAAGRVVWFHPTRGGANGAARRANGNLLLLDNGRGLLEVAPSGRVLAEVAQDSAARMIHHDVLEARDGSVLFLAQDWREARGTRVAGEAVWEWAPESGTLRRRWSAWDHLDAEREWGAQSVAHDWLHANAISLGPRGNVVMSLHYLNQVLSIAPDFGSLEWRLGGPGATHAVDAAERFSGQHTAAEIAPGRVLMFDNGFERVAERYSRAVEFALDPVAGRAVKVWEWRPTPDIWSRIVSLARRLPGGNHFVTFGSGAGVGGSSGPVAAFEVASDGRPIWRLEVGGVSLLYRAWPLADLAGESPVPTP